MTTGLRVGRVLLPAADGQVDYLPHAELRWRGGRIAAVTALPGPPPADALVWLPGMVDLHVHWAQHGVRGRFGGSLLPWLREAIWPAEAAFADPAVAAAGAQAFLADAVAAGIVAGLAMGPPFTAASRAFRRAAPRGWREGPALMEANGPAELLRPVRETLTELADAGSPASVAPRFAPSLSADGLRACGAFGDQTGWPIQSHLAENRDEIAWVSELHRSAADYTDVYDRAGLLGPRSVFAHAIHLSDREIDRLAATSTLVAHCPTSNVALASGRMPIERLRDRGVAWVLATDVGAGPKLSLFDVMATFLAVHAEAARVSAQEALARATAVPGAWLARFDPDLAGLGTFAVGAPAHLVGVTHAGGATAEAVVRASLEAVADAERHPREVISWGREASTCSAAARPAWFGRAEEGLENQASLQEIPGDETIPQGA